LEPKADSRRQATGDRFFLYILFLSDAGCILQGIFEPIEPPN
jgi:hypothetical protein